MKYITLASMALLGVFAAQTASAQCAYDAITNATVANYLDNTVPGYDLAGDIIKVAPPLNPNPTSFNQLSVIYVCDTAGNYTVGWEGRNGYAGGPMNPLPAPFVAGTGTFNGLTPGVWQFTWTGPCTALGALDQTFTFTSVPGLYVAFDDSAAIPAATGTKGFSYDINVVNGILDPSPLGEAEWFLENPGAPDEWNILFSLCGLCTPPPVLGDSLVQPWVVTKKKLSDKVPVNFAKDLSVLRTRVNKSL